MATLDPQDRDVLLEDMKKQMNENIENLHVAEIAEFKSRTYEAAEILVQRRFIKVLKEQLKDVETDLENVYAPQYARKDREAKDYLVYLLRMQEYRAKQCEKLREKVKEKEMAIQRMSVRMSKKNRELAKKIKSKMSQASSSKLLSLYENKLENAHHRLGEQTKVHREQREIMDHLLIMKLNYFKIFEEFQNRNEQDMKTIAQHLSNAVKIYKNREDLVYKTGILSERLKLDQQKTTSNSILLHRTKEKNAKAEEFETVKIKERPDCRSTQIEALLQKGITGLEPDVETAYEIREAISGITGTDDVDVMREMFRKSEQDNYNEFYSIENLHEEICGIEDEVHVLRESIHDMEKNLTEDQRICLNKIYEEQDKLEKVNAEVDEVETMKQNYISDLQTALTLAGEVISPPSDSSESETTGDPTDEDYVYEAMTAFENRINDILSALKYIKTHGAENQEEEEVKVQARKSDLEEVDLQISTEEATAICDKITALHLAEDVIKQDTSESFVDRDSVLDEEDVQETPTESVEEQEVVEEAEKEYEENEDPSNTAAN